MKEIYKTFNIVYKREYFSDEDTEWFWIGYSMYKNVPIEKIKYYRKQLLNFKKIMDNQYKEDATNFTGTTGIEIVYPDEYYQTYEDVFGDSAKDTMNAKDLWNDFGQQYERQGFRKDFDPDLTKNYRTRTDYKYNTIQ